MKQWNVFKMQRLFACLCVAVLVLSVLPLYAIAFYNHPYYDDFGLSAPVRRTWTETGSFSAILAAAVENEAATRNRWQGTYTSTFLSSLHPGIFSEDLYWLATFVLLTIFIAGIAFLFGNVFRHFGMSRCHRVSLTSLTLVIMIQFMPDPGEAFYWYNGGIAYLFDYALIAAACAVTIKLLCTRKAVPGLVLALAALMFLIGGGTYGGGLFALCMCVALIGWLFWKKHPKRVCFMLLTLLYAACFGYNMAAPGNAVRASYIHYEASAAKAILQSMYYGIGQLGGYITLPLMAVTLAMLPALYESARKSTFSFAHPWLVLFFGMCLYCTQFTPPLYSIASIGDGRILNTYFISFVVFWFVYAYYLLGYLARQGMKLPEMNMRRQGALWLVCLCLLGVGCLGFKREDDKLYGIQNMSGPSAMLSILTGEAAQYDQEMDQRELLLNDETLADITLAPLSKVPAVFMDDLIVPNATYDVRPSLCEYYGKESIRIAGEEDAL